MAYASPADVAALLARQLTDEEIALIERRLEQAERMILRRVPDLTGQIENGSIDHDDVIDIEAEAVYRVARNPEGYSSERDGTYTYRLSQEAADNSLRILPHEWELLGIRPRKMFTIDPHVLSPCRSSPVQTRG